MPFSSKGFAGCSVGLLQDNPCHAFHQGHFLPCLFWWLREKSEASRCYSSPDLHLAVSCWAGKSFKDAFLKINFSCWGFDWSLHVLRIYMYWGLNDPWKSGRAAFENRRGKTSFSTHRKIWWMPKVIWHVCPHTMSVWKGMFSSDYFIMLVWYLNTAKW